MKGFKWFCINLALTLAISVGLGIVFYEREIPHLMGFAVGLGLGFLPACSDEW